MNKLCNDLVLKLRDGKVYTDEELAVMIYDHLIHIWGYEEYRAAITKFITDDDKSALAVKMIKLDSSLKIGVN